MFVLALFPSPRCISPSKPKALTGRDAIRVESWAGAKLEKRAPVLAAPTGSHVGLGQAQLNGCHCGFFCLGGETARTRATDWGSLPAPSLSTSLSLSITLQLSTLKICQPSDSAWIPNVCICDLMHAESVYSWQRQTCLSYLRDEIMFPQHTQVGTGTGCCLAEASCSQFSGFWSILVPSRPQVVVSPAVRRLWSL